MLKEQVYALFCFGSLVRLRLRFSSPTATFGFGLPYLTERLPVPTTPRGRARVRDGRGCWRRRAERSTTNSQLGSQTEILPFLVFSDSNLLTNFPVESPASEALQSLCEGRNGVPSIQIHETRLEVLVYTHTERAVLKEESDSRNERDVVPAGIRAGPNPQNFVFVFL